MKVIVSIISLYLLIYMLIPTQAYSQDELDVGTTDSHPNCGLYLESDNASLVIPHHTNATRLSLGNALISTNLSAEVGGLVFDTEDQTFYWWTGALWKPLSTDQITNFELTGTILELFAEDSTYIQVDLASIDTDEQELNVFLDNENDILHIELEAGGTFQIDLSEAQDHDWLDANGSAVNNNSERIYRDGPLSVNAETDEHMFELNGGTSMDPIRIHDLPQGNRNHRIVRSDQSGKIAQTAPIYPITISVPSIPRSCLNLVNGDGDFHNISENTSDDTQVDIDCYYSLNQENTELSMSLTVTFYEPVPDETTGTYTHNEILYRAPPGTQLDPDYFGTPIGGNDFQWVDNDDAYDEVTFHPDGLVFRKIRMLVDTDGQDIHCGEAPYNNSAHSFIEIDFWPITIGLEIID